MNDVKDCMNNEFENDHSKELCAWIESIPFSKPKKNLSPLSLYRDFSDGVLLAEILKVYYPRYVDLHNYISANNYFLKKENWNTLNRKVLTKIDVKLNKDVVSQLVNGHQESIEKLLFEIRSKVDKIDQRDVLPLSATPNSEQNNRDDVKQPVNMNDDNCIETLTSENKNIQELAAPSHLTISYIKDAIFYAAIWLFSWFCFWNFFMNYRTYLNINNSFFLHIHTFYIIFYYSCEESTIFSVAIGVGKTLFTYFTITTRFLNKINVNLSAESLLVAPKFYLLHEN
ncbi:PREDICTED: uncharacterized protein LOC107065543 isoform X3 [Polistes dominula]|uniref:Uncharacterized protein LOC107065543 isoform X3 n=1 Tax=Polistes dominula TaxID=743375 RepID=A0ABM1I3Q0_POLDO|nr:PREDICTED: uncharacterized protein LOC107065543 isoform X3 [Polistes dominula]